MFDLIIVTVLSTESIAFSTEGKLRKQILLSNIYLQWTMGKTTNVLPVVKGAERPHLHIFAYVK